MKDVHAWFGTGMLGSAYVERLRANGVDVVAWNRTYEKAAALERFGARPIRDASEAARGATFLHVTLSDDAAVDELLAIVAPSMVPAAVLIDHSTTAPEPTAARFARMAALGRAFLHAPVFAAPPMARQGGGTVLISGASAVFDRARPSLEKMASDVWYLGDEPRGAAGMKLFGNQMLIAAIAALADGLSLARAAGIDAHRALELFNHFKLQGALQFRGKKMADRDYNPFFELVMARKDVRLMLETAAAAHAPLSVVPALAQRMDELLARGFGASDLSVLGCDVPA